MHECPDCGQACDCDGEDTWHDFDSPEVDSCDHECDDDDEDDEDWFDDEDDDEDEDDYFDDECDDDDEDSRQLHRASGSRGWGGVIYAIDVG